MKLPISGQNEGVPPSFVHIPIGAVHLCLLVTAQLSETEVIGHKMETMRGLYDFCFAVCMNNSF